MRALLFILLCLAAVPSMGLDVGEGRRKGPKYPLTYYLVNPELPCPLNVSRENDSVLRLWVDGPQSVGLSAEESEEWLSYETPGHRDIRLLENITDRFRPTAKVRRTRSRLLEKWTGLARIKNYRIEEAWGMYGFFVNGYPMFSTAEGNPYTPRGSMEESFAGIVTESVLSQLYPEMYLRFHGHHVMDGHNTESKDSYDIYVTMNQDVMRVEYKSSESGIIVDKYAIDLLYDIGVRNPGIHIGKLIYTTRGDCPVGVDKKAYDRMMKYTPCLEGKIFQILTLDRCAFSDAYVDDIWFIRQTSEIEKRTVFEIDVEKPMSQWRFTIEGKEIPWQDMGIPCAKGRLFRGDDCR